MKKFLVKGFIALTTLGFVSVALAETSTNASTTPRPFQQIKDARAEAKVQIKDIKENLASTTKELRDEMKDNLKDNIKRRTENRFEKMLDRYEATIDRETAIMNKLSTRVEKVKANGGNTTEAEKLISEAKIHLGMATTSLATLKTQAEKQNSLENSSTTVQTLRNGIIAMKKTGAEIEKHLRETHKLLQKIVGVLRGVSGLRPATTTPSTATTTN